MPKLGLDQIKAKREKIALQLAELQEQERAELDRRATVVGQAVLAHADGDPTFAQTLNTILGERVRKNADRALCGLPPRARKARTTS